MMTARDCSKCTENLLSKSYCCIVIFRVFFKKRIIYENHYEFFTT